MKDGLQFSEWLAYNREETRRWQEFFRARPEALDLPLDIAGTVRGLVQHIFTVELYFADKLSDLNAQRERGAGLTFDEMFAMSGEADRKYQEFQARAQAEDWDELVELRLGGLKASKRRLVVQALTHSMRHWAQIATFLRQQGFKQDWIHDFLMSDAMK
jgi:uncharacterized damage-inducible protein DinB